MHFIEIDQSEHGPERRAIIPVKHISSISYLKGENLIHIQICTSSMGYEVAFNLDEEARAKEYYQYLHQQLRFN